MVNKIVAKRAQTTYFPVELNLFEQNEILSVQCAWGSQSGWRVIRFVSIAFSFCPYTYICSCPRLSHIHTDVMAIFFPHSIRLSTISGSRWYMYLYYFICLTCSATFSSHSYRLIFENHYFVVCRLTKDEFQYPWIRACIYLLNISTKALEIL